MIFFKLLYQILQIFGGIFQKRFYKYTESIYGELDVVIWKNGTLLTF